VGAGRVLLEQFSGHVELECQTAEHRTQAVVQIPAEAAAFLLPRGNEALARALEVGREPDGLVGEAHRMGGHPDLVGKVL
jgi:hypothetical protein